LALITEEELDGVEQMQDKKPNQLTDIETEAFYRRF
jgi:hypothetical protein